MDELLAPEHYRAVWERKPVLRAVYQGYYRQMAEACCPGPTLEIGGGSGNLKEFLPAVVCTDIRSVPWLDVVADAHALPFATGSFSNIVMLDVLHHIVPRPFLMEAKRVLCSGGRIIMIEPAMTLLARVFYKFFHPEPVDMDADPLAATAETVHRDPAAGNQAIPHLLFGRHRARFERDFPDLRVRHLRHMSLFAYPLSGGFRDWTLLPGPLASPLLAVETALNPALSPLMGFRMFVTIERA